MLFEAEGLTLLLVLGLAVWGWQSLLRMRERALAVTAQICQQCNVQCLDQSVVLGSLRARWIENGAPRLVWRYLFEFSLGGYDRHRGEVVLVGRRLEWARLEHPEGPLYVDGAGARRSAN